MTEPYIKIWQVGEQQIASIVLDKKDFDALCDELSGIAEYTTGERATDDIIQQIKDACHIPMISRGTKTEFLFERYNIGCDRASVIVRGYGGQLAAKLFGPLVNPEVN